MVGESVGAYKIVAKLGEGGMGAVYLGEHQRIARKAAIKVLLPEFSANPQIVARFFNEARATSLIRHPGIVEVTDCDVLPSGNAYIVMEALEGESLGSYLRRGGRLSVQRAAFLTRHIADALAAAHEQRIVHRDLKPDNVFLLPDGGAAASQPIKILDFGIAKLVHGEAGEGNLKTRTGVILGTPVYMSPEQCRGVGTVDHRTDIYSLGCILFEMICGQPPFTSEGFGELIHSHLSVTPPTLRSFDPALPASMDALVARMLAKAPGDRPQTMRGLIGELLAAVAAVPAGSGAPTMTAPVVRQGGTMLLEPAESPNVHTTLRSASAEKMSAVKTGEEQAVAKSRRLGLVFAGAAMAVVAGGIGLWRASVKGPAGAAAGGYGTEAPVAAAVPVSHPALPPPAPPSAAPQIPTPPVAEALRPVPRPPAHAASLPSGPLPRTMEQTPPAVVSRKVKVVIASNPSGADVCLTKDRILLGRTSFEWRPEKSSRVAKLMIRKHGYRGEEISVATDHDVTKQVSLGKLGPDDIDDTDTCERKR
jgi:hypothetical protein